MKAIAYVRVSDQRQIENTSLDTQEQVCRKWCADRKISVDRVFRDEGESAKTADRPGFQEMLKYVELKRTDLSYCVVYKFNRFARSAEDHLTYRTLLQARGVRLCSATESTDNSPFGRATESILAVFNQLDNEMRAENTVRGMRERIKNGYWQWKPPIGYISVPRSHNSPATLAIDSERGPLVQKAFSLIASGVSKAEALRQVIALGLRTVKGKAVSPQTFEKLLKNPVYAGRIVVPKWNVDVPGAFPALIEEALFVRVQYVLAGRQLPDMPRARANPSFPLRGLLVCTICKRKLTASKSTGRWGGRYGYYRCVRNHVNLPATLVEERFLSLLGELRPESDRLRLVIEVFKDVWHKKRGDAEAHRAALHTQLSKLKDQKRRAVKARVEGDIDSDDFREYMTDLNDQLNLVQSEVSRHEQDLDVSTAVGYIEHLLWNPQMLWNDSDLGHKQQLQRALFPNGIKVSKTEFGTPSNSCFYNLIQASKAGEENLASPRGFEPLLSP